MSSSRNDRRTTTKEGRTARIRRGNTNREIEKEWQATAGASQKSDKSGTVTTGQPKGYRLQCTALTAEGPTRDLRSDIRWHSRSATPAGDKRIESEIGSPVIGNVERSITNTRNTFWYTGSAYTYLPICIRISGRIFQC